MVSSRDPFPMVKSDQPNVWGWSLGHGLNHLGCIAFVLQKVNSKKKTQMRGHEPCTTLYGAPLKVETREFTPEKLANRKLDRLPFLPFSGCKQPLYSEPAHYHGGSKLQHLENPKTTPNWIPKSMNKANRGNLAKLHEPVLYSWKNLKKNPKELMPGETERCSLVRLEGVPQQTDLSEWVFVRSILASEAGFTHKNQRYWGSKLLILRMVIALLIGNSLIIFSHVLRHEVGHPILPSKGVNCLKKTMRRTWTAIETFYLTFYLGKC